MPDTDTGEEVLEEVVGLLCELVRFRSTADRPDQLEALANFVEDYAREAPLHVRRYRFGDKPALVLTTRDTTEPTLFYQGHLDVVDGEDEQFEPKIVGDRLYGRGTVDMKGFVALILHLLKRKALEGSGLDVGAMLTFDEEIGGENGAARLAELGWRSKILLNGDGGYNFALTYAEKGILKFKMAVRTQPGRHPYPWQGQNAFDLLIRNYNRVVALFPEQDVATDTDNWYTTFSSYDVRVENGALSAPHYAELKMNVYFTKPWTAEECFRRIRNVVDDRVELTLLSKSARVYVNPDNPVFRQMQAILEKHFGRPFPARAENGSSDARFFTGKGIDILILKLVGEGHHTSNEYVHIPSILPMYRAVEEFTERFARVGRSSDETVEARNEVAR